MTKRISLAATLLGGVCSVAVAGGIGIQKGRFAQPYPVYWVDPHVSNWGYSINTTNSPLAPPGAHATAGEAAQSFLDSTRGSGECIYSAPNISNFASEAETHGISWYETASASGTFRCTINGDGTYGFLIHRNRQLSCPEYPYQWSEDSTYLCAATINEDKSCPVTNPISLPSGKKVQQEVDYQSAGNALRFERLYSSEIRPSGGELGSWRSNLHRQLYLGNVADGKLFLAQGRGARTLQKSGDQWTVTDVDGSGDYIVQVTNAGATYWRQYKRRENIVETYDSAGRLHLIEAIDGKKVSYTYVSGLLSKVSDTFGRSLGFSYDESRRLKRLTDPAGAVYRYGYDEATAVAPIRLGLFLVSNITSVTYPDERRRLYWYNEQDKTEQEQQPIALTGITDESGARFATYGYSKYGDTILSEHANGAERHTFDYKDRYSSVTVTDSLGAAYKYSFESAPGGGYRRTNLSQPAGSGCAASSSSLGYDANGNLAQEDDFDGNRTCRLYDQTRNLEISRVEGAKSWQGCSAMTSAGAKLSTGVRKTSSQWHPQWGLVTKTAQPGLITTYTYNGQGVTCAPATAKLSDGTALTVLCSKTEQATTDADGALGFDAPADTTVSPRVWRYTYNQYGQVVTAVDPRGKTTTYAYYGDTTADHTVGDLQSLTNVLGHVTKYSKYDPHGQLLQTVDPNGVATTRKYDVRQRLTTTTVGNQSTSYEYWPTGLLKKMVQADGAWVAYGYDDAHRLTDVEDNLGNRVHYTLDGKGKRIKEEVKDPQGILTRQMSRVMDALGRVELMTGRD